VFPDNLNRFFAEHMGTVTSTAINELEAPLSTCSRRLPKQSIKITSMGSILPMICVTQLAKIGVKPTGLRKLLVSRMAKVPFAYSMGLTFRCGFQKSCRYNLSRIQGTALSNLTYLIICFSKKLWNCLIFWAHPHGTV